jgi:hypothetical protein
MNLSSFYEYRERRGGGKLKIEFRDDFKGDFGSPFLSFYFLGVA